MSISGMTGFARAEGEHEGQRWIWELKSVNGRGLDLKLRTPPGFDGLEPAARAAANAKFKRGSLHANLQLARAAEGAANVRVDLDLARKLIEAGAAFVKDKQVKKPRWDGILQARGVILAEDGAEMSEEARAALEAALAAGFHEALAGLDAARRAEGRSLAAILTEAADRLD
ncbi:MAG TPA: hypothetical protein PKY87_18060, partial [Terricaulis sp.]|nr:hypothetical protein [Terricaulis sp.]